MENIEDLSREEQINFVVGQFSGHEKEEEIAAILSILASYKVTDSDYLKYYDALTSEEISQRINSGILCIYSENQWQEEENAWNSILDCLGIGKVIDIIDNCEKYIEKYLKIEDLVEDMRKRLYNDFFLLAENI